MPAMPFAQMPTHQHLQVAALLGAGLFAWLVHDLTLGVLVVFAEVALIGISHWIILARTPANLYLVLRRSRWAWIIAAYALVALIGIGNMR